LKRYIVFLCKRCGFPSMARDNQKTSACRKCGYTNEIELTRLRVLLQTDDMKEAQAVIQHVKTNRKQFPIKKVTPVGKII